jgi:DNA-binding MarR family transcriptional regulator
MSPVARTPRRQRKASITRTDYQTLAEFRHQIAAFLRRRREAAEKAGLEAQQYELLLAVKGLPSGKSPTIKQIAEQLQIQHHSAVELTSRLAKRGLIQRRSSSADKRLVLLSITKTGEKVTEQVARYGFRQLKVEAPKLLKTLDRLLSTRIR